RSCIPTFWHPHIVTHYKVGIPTSTDFRNKEAYSFAAMGTTALTLCLLVSLLILRVSALGQTQITVSEWHDPSPHRVQFVTVEPGVQLEVLDWGGTGRPVVLLGGLGMAAHVFDGFAERLAQKCHVYGITSRGYGASTRPASGYE